MQDSLIRGLPELDAAVQPGEISGTRGKDPSVPQVSHDKVAQSKVDASLLETSVASVNSALQRARGDLAGPPPKRRQR